MKVKFIDKPATVYSDTDLLSNILAQMPIDSEVELGGVKEKNGQQWVTVILPSGLRGYVPGDTRIFEIKVIQLLDASTNLFATPSAQTSPLAQYPKNTRIELIGSIDNEEGSWVKVRNATGQEGFISGNTRIQKIVPAAATSRAVASKNILHGALWCLGGTAVTIITYSMVANGGGTYVVAWGAIVFGAIQFLQGIFQLVTAKG